jgi:hypothetical protein
MIIFRKIREHCASLSLNCQEAVRAQSEQLDHPLPRLTRIGLRLHLLLCKWCRRYGKQIRWLHQAAHNHDEKWAQTNASVLSKNARERMKRALKSANEG